MSSVSIVGFSGSGKSSSYGENKELGIVGLDPKTTAIFNVSGKDLPFRGWQSKYKGKLSEGGNYFESSDAKEISDAMAYVNANRPDIKSIILDDSQYIMAFEYMRRAKETGYNKFTDLGVNVSKIVEVARTSRRDLTVYFLWHPEVDSKGEYKIKTVGAMVDQYLTLEGLFTVVLYMKKPTKGTDNKMKYEFVTNNDGEYPAKSPAGMFSQLYIPNDLALVEKAIASYNKGE